MLVAADARLKTLSYLDNVLARGAGLRAGADEALMLNTAGEVACAAAANIFWVEDQTLCTPALECGVLDGIVRAQVLRAAPGLGLVAREVRAGPERLAGRSVFLTSSLIGLRPVATLDGRPTHPWPPLSRLAAALASA